LQLQQWDEANLVFEEQYNVWGKRLFPWDGLEEPDWGGAWVVVDPGTTSAPHAHDENEMFFIVQGEGELRIDEERRRVAPGDTIFITPCGEHALTNDGDERLVFLTIWWGGAEAEAETAAAS
jgi:mannose-6-phosphate isomerase-like protein (cupin superfamily)